MVITCHKGEEQFFFPPPRPIRPPPAREKTVRHGKGKEEDGQKPHPQGNNDPTPVPLRIERLFPPLFPKGVFSEAGYGFYGNLPLL